MRSIPASRRHRQAGQNMIEFALVFLIFISFFMAMFNFGWALFVKATLHQAAMAGVRYAITGPDGGAAGQDAAIKEVV
jgi:Flp pilus assembly protein TadG